jgi:hypothetical protein
MIAGKTLTEYGPTPASAAVERVWEKVNDLCRPKGERKI